MRKSIVLATLVLFGAAPAAAQTFGFGAHAGVSLPTGDYGDIAETGFSGGLDLAYPLMMLPGLSWYSSVDAVGHSVDEETANVDGVTTDGGFLLVPAMTGQMPVFLRARSEREIRTVLLFLDEFPELQPVLVGGDQAFRAAEELASRGIPVIVGSADRPTRDRSDPIAAAWENARILHAAGVKIAFATEDYADVRNLPYSAARSVAFGLPAEEGLRAVTLSPAEILGLGDVMGSLDVGKRADVIVTDGDPLQIVTNVEQLFIGGEEVSLESKHTRLWKEFRDRH